MKGLGRVIPPKAGRAAWAQPHHPSTINRDANFAPDPETTQSRTDEKVINPKAKDEQELYDESWWSASTAEYFVKPVPNVPPTIIPKKPWKNATKVKWAVTCDLSDDGTQKNQKPRVIPPRKVGKVIPPRRSAEEMAQDPKIIVPLCRYSYWWQGHGGSRYCMSCKDLYENKHNDLNTDCCHALSLDFEATARR